MIQFAQKQLTIWFGVFFFVDNFPQMVRASNSLAFTKVIGGIPI